MTHILLVEDEDHLAQGLAFNLRNKGYDVAIAGTGTAALESAQEQVPDLVLLDVMLPDITGFEVAKRLRESGFLEPILMVTARDRREDAIAGLDAGADDYISKPYDLDELLARIRGSIRRQSWSRTPEDETEPGNTFAFGEWEIDRDAFVARHSDGREERLTLKELAVLRLLASRPGEVVSREEFLTEVWGLPKSVETRTVDNFIRKLRQMIEPNPSRPCTIVSVRGAGYRFDPATD
ncbi:MAG: response regulator transcription factor [Planctomycetota bacterium]